MGVESRPALLYIEDHQLLKTEFLEYLNSLISSGEIPGLYQPEELEPIMSGLQDEMKNQYECRTVFEFFISRIKKNLRVVLSLDCSHQEFTTRCASNPALFTNCSVIWNEAWSRESMAAVAKSRLHESLSKAGAKEEDLYSMLLQLHASSGGQDSTPLKYNILIKTYKEIFERKMNSQGGQSKHLMIGLTKLADAEETVDQLSQQAQDQKVQLKKKQAEADEALARIQAAMEQMAKARQEVETLQNKCKHDQKFITEKKGAIEEELSEIQPAVDRARAAVGELRPDNLNEIRSYKMPPDAIHDVLNGVMRLMGVEDTSWNSMKKFLASKGVI